MPGLARSEWYDLTGDMNWTLSYVDQEEAWPQGIFEGDFVVLLVPVDTDDPMTVVAQKIAHHVAGRRCPLGGRGGPGRAVGR